MEHRGKCKASKRPYMKLFTSDYRDGTAQLSFEVQGFYMRILTYLNDGDTVPSDPIALGRFLQCSARTVRKLLPPLLASGKLFQAGLELKNPRIERELEANSTPVQSEFEPNSAPKIQKDESNQWGYEPYYGEGHYHCHSHSQKEEPNTHTEQEAARDGEVAVGHGVFVNCETIRHKTFTISIPALELLTGGRFPRDEIKSKAQGHALAWAAEIDGGKRPGDVVPAKIANFLSASLMGDFNRQQCADVRKAKAEKQASKPTVAEIIAKRQAAEAMGASA